MLAYLKEKKLLSLNLIYLVKIMAKSYIYYNFYYNLFFISKNKFVKSILRIVTSSNGIFTSIFIIFCTFFLILAIFYIFNLILAFIITLISIKIIY